jgi:hypothetical protein
MGELTKYSAHKIYELFTSGRGTNLLDNGQAASRKEWELEDDRAQMIRKQGDLIRTGWQGRPVKGPSGRPSLSPSPRCTEPIC